MMLTLAKNGILAGCFTPCADGRSLLKTSAVAERRAVARKVLLHSIDDLRLNWPGFFERSTFAAALHNLPTLYDAYYLALAQARGCDFWTADRRFVNSVPQVPCVRDIRDFATGMLER